MMERPEINFPISEEMVAAQVEQARTEAARNENVEIYKRCYSAIDLTQLHVTDSERHIRAFASKAVKFPYHFPQVSNVASICVFPNFVETVGLALGDSDLAITSVGAGFPASQTFLEVKMLEVAMAVEHGADEIDIVINLGAFLDGDYEPVMEEIAAIRSVAGSDTVLKVIIESGALRGAEEIALASMLAMHAGADFVKTSTGKIGAAATPEAAVAICMAIQHYYRETGRKVGFKAAGGIRTPQDAALYYTIVENMLGREWLTPRFFRIGASSLANSILSAITGKEVAYY